MFVAGGYLLYLRKCRIFNRAHKNRPISYADFVLSGAADFLLLSLASVFVVIGMLSLLWLAYENGETLAANLIFITLLYGYFRVINPKARWHG